MSTLDLGKVRPTFEGVWANRAYEAVSVVMHNNVTYMSALDVPAGHPPDTPGTIYWFPIATQGAPGLPGVPGPPGIPGPPGEMDTQLRIDVFENNGAGPLLRTDIMPVGTFDTAALIALNISSFTTDEFIWVNSGNGTGSLTIRKAGTFRVWCQGGGGGGGGGGHTLATASGGGSGGETKVKTVFIPAGTVVPVTIGAGGEGGKYQYDQGGVSKTGSPGSTTSFGSILSALGGPGGNGFQYVVGSGAVSATLGGVLTATPTDSIPAMSQPGHAGHVLEFIGGYHVKGGHGGASLFGRGAAWSATVTSPVGATAHGYNGTGYGAGGGGGAGTANYGFNGGNGSGGCIYVERVA